MTLTSPGNGKRKPEGFDPYGCAGAARRLPAAKQRGWRPDRRGDPASRCAVFDLYRRNSNGKKILVRKGRKKKILCQGLLAFFLCPSVEMNLLLGALSALLSCSWSSSKLLDPAGKNVCRSVRYFSTTPPPSVFSLLQFQNDGSRSSEVKVSFQLLASSLG